MTVFQREREQQERRLEEGDCLGHDDDAPRTARVRVVQSESRAEEAADKVVPRDDGALRKALSDQQRRDLFKAIDRRKQPEFGVRKLCRLALNAAQGPIWCPLRSRERPWFSMNKLRRKFGHGIFGGKQCTIS